MHISIYIYYKLLIARLQESFVKKSEARLKTLLPFKIKNINLVVQSQISDNKVRHFRPKLINKSIEIQKLAHPIKVTSMMEETQCVTANNSTTITKLMP